MTPFEEMSLGDLRTAVCTSDGESLKSIALHLIKRLKAFEEPDPPPMSFDAFVCMACNNRYAPTPVEQHTEHYLREYTKYLERNND